MSRCNVKNLPPPLNDGMGFLEEALKEKVTCSHQLLQRDNGQPLQALKEWCRALCRH